MRGFNALRGGRSQRTTFVPSHTTRTLGRAVCTGALALFGLGSVAQAQVVVEAGDDAWVSPGGTFADFNAPCPPIPADFFGPGSPAVSTVIPFAGKPLKTAPPGILGATDTIVRRLTDTVPLLVGGIDTIPIEIVALDLVSTAPITVGGGFGTWDVEACLSSVMPQPGGSMTIRLLCDDGGNYDATLDVIPKFIFTETTTGQVIVMDPAPLKSFAGSCEWALVGGPAGFDPAMLGIPEVLPGVLVDGDCNGAFEAVTIGDSNFRGGVGGACAMPPAFVAIFCAEAEPCAVHQFMLGQGTGGEPLEKELLITEVVDGTLPGGQPKWVELTNISSGPVDMTQYSLGNYNNGSTLLGGGSSTPLAGGLPSGASYVVGYEADPGGPGLSNFFNAYGLELDFYMGGGFINGDDVIALFKGVATGDGSDAPMVDVYGVLGTDGTGEVWETTDSYGIRCGDEPNCGIFDAGDWLFPGADALEAGCAGDDVCELANLLAATTPFVHAGCNTDNTGSATCFGDGTGNPCPCANPGGPGEGCANSTGVGGVLVGLGNAAFGADTFGLAASGLPAGVPGLCVKGSALLGGGLGNPVGDGLLCTGPQLRSQVLFSSAGGNVSMPTWRGQPFGTFPGAANGGGVPTYYQIWYRNPPGPCGGLFNFTNAWVVVWAP